MDATTAGLPTSVLALKRWKVIYPAYLNSKKTVAEGRKLKKEKCVDNPTIQEIKDILENAGLRVFVEPRKMYSRDNAREPTLQGRVRVEIVNEQGKLANETFPHKLAVLHYLGDMIPKLKGRVAQAQSAAQSSSSQAQSGAGKGKQKSKGNKRK